MPVTLSAVREEDVLRISCRVAGEQGPLEIRLKSDRSARVEKASDVSPHAPPGWKATNPRYVFPGQNRELCCLAVDVAAEADMQGVVRIANPDGGPYFWNPPLQDVQGHLDGDLVIPADQLEHWENCLFLAGSRAHVTGFHLRLPVPAGGGLQREVKLLTADWSGVVSLHRGDDGTELASARVEASPAHLDPLPATTDDAGCLPREVLVEGLCRILDQLMRSRNMNPASRTYGGFFLLYDADARMRRASHWLWAWGPAIRLLLDARHVRPIAERFGADELLAAAELAGRASLRFVTRGTDHPARGLATVRWEPTCDGESGFREFISAADSLYLSGWGWLPLYETTGDERYLTAARDLADATERLMDTFPLVPQEYEPDVAAWTRHTYDESAFGMDGLTELARVTGERRYVEMGRRFMDSHLKRFERDDGLWHRLWWRGEQGPQYPIDTKGEAWVMAGLLAAHRLAPDGGYLVRAQKLADRLIALQQRDGRWNSFIDDPPSPNPINDKATAIWAYLMQRTHAHTARGEYLASARRALAWCLANQHTGPDRQAVAAILPLAGFMQVNFHHLTVLYTTTFLGLAILEELRRTEGDDK